MPLSLKSLFSHLESIAPLELAESWDNCGLLIGDDNQRVGTILLALELTPAVLDEATRCGAGLVITHHPVLMKPVKKLLTSPSSETALATEALRRGIQVYCAHTNIDIAWGGLNDYLCQLLHIKVQSPLVMENVDELYKVIVCLPRDEDALESISQAMYKAGAGVLGPFTHRAFISEGRATYKNLDDHRAKMNEECSEFRLEATVHVNDVENVTNAIYMTHPYHTPPIDLIPLKTGRASVGLGRIGSFEQPKTLPELVEQLKKTLGLTHVSVANGGAEQISQVAVVTGSGGSLVKQASKAGADVYITGDLKYHDAIWAIENGLTVIDCGHFGTERIFSDLMEKLSATPFPRSQW